MSRVLLSAQAYAVIDSLHVAAGRITTRESGIETDWGTIRFALDGQSQRHLLVPIASDTTVREDRRSAGVQLRDLGQLEERGPHYVDLVCLRPHLATVFEVLVDELLDILDGSGQPVHDIHTVLSRWRELFDRPHSRLLGVEQLAGLVGELVVLRSLALAGPSVSTDWWTGPAGHIHDIVGPGHDVEVKTTLKRDDSLIVVNGLAQFADVPDRELNIFLVRLSHDGAGDLSLPDLIDELAELGLDRSGLISLAGSVGADSRDFPAYREMLFKLLEMKAYVPSVPGFPRLTGHDLQGPVPQGVTTVSYVADLNVAEKSAIVGDALGGLLRSIAN